MRTSKLLQTLKVAILIALPSVVMQLASCSGEKEKQHATEICLPDSALVGKVLPLVDGTLADYFSIVPEAYKINLTDSVLKLNVKLHLENKYTAEAYMQPNIANTESALSKYPYIVLVDSVGNAIPNLCLQVDTAEVKQLLDIMIASESTDVNLTFATEKLLTEEQCDSLAALARNFKLVASVVKVADVAAIDALLSEYEKKADSQDQAERDWEKEQEATRWLN